ncbi:MAG: glycosyltransferase family 4 protein [bacterium]|nr:glycosyltransferase family 4 protein [bacterium]
MHIVVACGNWRLIGGSERYALDVVAALAARGYEISVLYGVGDPEPVRGMHFVRFEPLAAGALATGPERRGELSGILGGIAPDLVLQLTPAATWIVETLQTAAPHVRFVQDHTLFCPGLNKMLADGTPCADPLGSICVKRARTGPGCSGLRDKPRKRLAAKRAELLAHQDAALLLVASEYMRGELVATGIDPARIAVLPYPTHAALKEPGELPPETRAFLDAADGPVIGTAARLALPDKGVDYLLTALGKMRDPVHCVIAGTGPAEDWLREKARAEGLEEHVHFAGWMRPEEIEALYARADVVVMPSVWDEPFGLVGIEAMAHGTPVVAFEVGGVAEWLSAGVGGWLVPRGDTVALARAIERLARDGDLARLIAAAGKRRVERQFRMGRHVERLESLLETVGAVSNRI